MDEDIRTDLTASEITLAWWKSTHDRLGTFYKERDAMQTDSEATPLRATPDADASAAGAAADGGAAAPDPATPDPEVTHGDPPAAL